MANYYDPRAYSKLPGRSKFDLSYRNSFPMKMGQLVPVVCEQIIPGDRFRVGLTYQMQLAPMLNPVYDGLEVNFEAFFVPNRILDAKWRDFWTGYNEYDQMTPVEVSPLKLSIQVGGIQNILDSMPDTANPPLGLSSLADFIGYQHDRVTPSGIPIPRKNNSDNSELTTLRSAAVNAYPFLAYNRIWDDWYRNERTQRASLYDWYNNYQSGGGNSINRYILSNYIYSQSANGNFTPVPTDGPFVPVQLHYRNYKKDRFTTALPEPIIAGDVRIPVSDESFSSAISSTDAIITQNSQVDFNLNALALGTIQQLKLALKEYQYRMKDTYNGNRYVESLYSHYGVVVPDSTLQRSIYLGSARDYVNFGEVYQTSAGDGDSSNGALGDYAGRGAANGTHYLFDESFFECGFFFVLMSIAPRSRYFQGAKRFLTRFDRDDYFSPEYQNIGDDFIETSELFNNDVEAWSFGNATPITSDVPHESSIFGFNSRWIEHKQRYDELHGDFANPESPMFNWNFARNFVNEPVISPEFSAIRPINKPFVDLSDANDNYFVDVAIKMEALRPILAVESF